jgi:TetR/AcrR family transcriptional regulator, cholesterol catabolism regulator
MNDDIREAVMSLKRERIVAAAVDLFYRNGFGHTTLDQVAEQMGMTKPFIYAHFNSKTELLAAICAQGISVSLQAINRALASSGSARERLTAFAHDFMLAVLESQKHIAIYTREEKNLEPSDREIIRNMRREFDRKLTGLLDRGVANGEFTINETPLAALAIGGIASWASVWYRPGGRLPAQVIARQMAELMLAMTQVDRPAPIAPRHLPQKETTP